MGLREELFKKREQELQENQEVTEIERIEVLDYDNIMNTLQKPYLEELPKAEPIKVFQLQQLFYPKVYVFVKPNNHKTYWEGEAIYIPSSFYECDVKDIGLRKKYEGEDFEHGSVSIFIDKLPEWEETAIKRELDDINEYYKHSL